MSLRSSLTDWLSTYWLVAFLGGDAIVLLVAVLLWRPGTRTIASALFVFGLIPPLAVLAELLAPRQDE